MCSLQKAKDDPTPAATKEDSDTDMPAAPGDGEATAGDADSVTRPPLYPSSSPESDHNYAKPELSDVPSSSSSKGAMVGGKRSSGVDPLRLSFDPSTIPDGDDDDDDDYGDGDNDDDDLEAEVSVAGVQARRVLRGHPSKMEAVKSQPPTKQVVEAKLKLVQGRGALGKKSLPDREIEAGKVTSSESNAICSPPEIECHNRVPEQRHKTSTRHDSMTLRQKKSISSPNRVHKPFMKSQRQRKANSKSVLQMIKKTISQEAKAGKSRLELNRAKTKSKTKTEKGLSSDDETLPPLTDMRPPRAFFLDRKLPDRNLFDEFSKESVNCPPKTTPHPSKRGKDRCSTEQQETSRGKACTAEHTNTKSDQEDECSETDVKGKLKRNSRQSLNVRTNSIAKVLGSKAKTSQTSEKVHTPTESESDAKMKSLVSQSKYENTADSEPVTEESEAGVSEEKTDSSKPEVPRRLSRRESRCLADVDATEPEAKGSLSRKGLRSRSQESTHNPAVDSDTYKTPKQMKLGVAKQIKGSSSSAAVVVGLASTNVLCRNDGDASKSSLGLPEHSQPPKGPNSEPDPVPEEGVPMKSDAKVGTRKVRGLQSYSPAEPPILSHLSAQSAPSRRPLERTDKSVSEGPGNLQPMPATRPLIIYLYCIVRSVANSL